MDRINTRRARGAGVGVIVGVDVSVGVALAVEVAVSVGGSVSVGGNVGSGVDVASPGTFGNWQASRSSNEKKITSFLLDRIVELYPLLMVPVFFKSCV